MFMKMALAAALALAAHAVLCAQSGDNNAPRVRREMLVTTAWLAAHLHDPSVLVLCVGATPDFCGKEHIPGASQILLTDIAVTRNGAPNQPASVEKMQQAFAAAGMSNSSRVVLYGERQNLMAARAYFTLDYLGVADHVALLDGGIDKWRAEQRPLSAEATPVKPGSLWITPRPRILVDTIAMRTVIQQKPDVVLIDARPAKEYSGEQLSEDVQQAGHIPGAASLFWMDMLVSRENPVLRPEPELRRMFEQARARAGHPLITYCRTGMQASFDYFVAKYLGYEASMYGPSFFEWSAKGLPVEKSPSQ